MLAGGNGTQRPLSYLKYIFKLSTLRLRSRLMKKFRGPRVRRLPASMDFRPVRAFKISWRDISGNISLISYSTHSHFAPGSACCVHERTRCRRSDMEIISLGARTDTTSFHSNVSALPHMEVAGLQRRGLVTVVGLSALTQRDQELIHLTHPIEVTLELFSPPPQGFQHQGYNWRLCLDIAGTDVKVELKLKWYNRVDLCSRVDERGRGNKTN